MCASVVAVRERFDVERLASPHETRGAGPGEMPGRSSRTGVLLVWWQVADNPVMVTLAYGWRGGFNNDDQSA